jgi:hypothetical protein
VSRQHVAPLLIDATGVVPLDPLPLGAGPEQISEAELQHIIHCHVDCLPIAEIDPLFREPVPICTELITAAGPIDNLMLTSSGLPVLVECKLWRNPEGRRSVVGQILDYAKELRRWTSSDLQREVARNLRRSGPVLLELMREHGREVDEASFYDDITHNLRKGRFLLLIVGDGIREGVEAIAEYLADAGLHFSLGLIETPLFRLPDGRQLMVPRILARTTLITREVVEVPPGFTVRDAGAPENDPDILSDEAGAVRMAFMRELLAEPFGLDPDQPTPQISGKGWLFLYLPAPASSCWISVLFKEGGRRVGVRLSSNANTIGETAIGQVIQEWDAILPQLGGFPVLKEQSPGRFVVEELRTTTNFGDPDRRAATIAWVRNRLRDFVGVFRPRIRDAIEAMKD